jgi:hypothetical protein
MYVNSHKRLDNLPRAWDLTRAKVIKLSNPPTASTTLYTIPSTELKNERTQTM